MFLMYANYVVTLRHADLKLKIWFANAKIMPWGTPCTLRAPSWAMRWIRTARMFPAAMWPRAWPGPSPTWTRFGGWMVESWWTTCLSLSVWRPPPRWATPALPARHLPVRPRRARLRPAVAPRVPRSPVHRSQVPRAPVPWMGICRTWLYSRVILPGPVGMLDHPVSRSFQLAVRLFNEDFDTFGFSLGFGLGPKLTWGFVPTILNYKWTFISNRKMPHRMPTKWPSKVKLLSRDGNEKRVPNLETDPNR
jgi:hypothetical protein